MKIRSKELLQLKFWFVDTNEKVKYILNQNSYVNLILYNKIQKTLKQYIKKMK